MKSLSLNDLKYIDQQQCDVIDKSGNKKNIIIICFNSNNEIEDFKNLFHQINYTDVVFHTDLESCISFIRSIKKQKIFLVILSSSFQILSNITQLCQIDSIFILCLDNDQYEYLPIQNPKIIDIYHNMDLLRSSIQEQISLVNKQCYLCSFFNQREHVTKDLSKQPSDFIWLHLFHDAIIYLSHDEHATKQMIQASRYYH